MSHAWEGYALSKGIKKDVEKSIPNEQARKALRAREEREAKQPKDWHGNAR